MRTESCRQCGIEMQPDKECDICHNYVNFHCPKCGTRTDLQIHIHNQ